MILSIYIKIEPKMYYISLIENGWTDLAQMILIVRNCQKKVFTRKIFGKVLLFNKS
jgi:RNA:NAD 2'-phosphotransferase (TPT1/KptA family)